MNAQDETARSSSSLRAAPVTAREFASRMSSLDAGKTVAVAFSGGPDSLALLLLASRWVRGRKGAKLHAFTVDHGLRAASAAEARRAAAMAAQIGVPHRILRWKGEKPSSGIQAAARDARYALLLSACRKAGIGDLLVAHHLEDQAETFLLRLARGSGVDGLAAMPASRFLSADAPQVRLLRPLLDLPRTRLAATVSKARLAPILDPSNEDERFDRVKARKALALLAPLGLDASRLARTAAQMARAREALEAETQALLSEHASISPLGFAEVRGDALAAVPAETGLRVLAALVAFAGGRDYGPRLAGLEAVHAAILEGELGRGRTLGGVKLAFRKDVLTVTREVSAARQAPSLWLRVGEEGVWDGRFRLSLTRAPRNLRFEVRALGPEGLSDLRARKAALPQMPSAVLHALPGLWQGRKLIGAPHLETFGRDIELHVSLRRMPGRKSGNPGEKA